MKLIDLDAKEPYLLDGRYSVGIPDNASTVHYPNCDICEDKAKQYSLGFQDGYLTGKERPQGEWTNKHFEHADCSLCGRTNDYHGDFCKYCGADMRKGGAE